MSTRAQILVQGGINNDKVMLYRHSDGYPTEVLRSIKQAFDNATSSLVTWQAGRGGYASSYIIAEGVSEYGPAYQAEPGHDLHGDIEWFYVVDVSDGKGGPQWRVTVYDTCSRTPHDPDTHNFVASGLIQDIINQAEEIEAA